MVPPLQPLLFPGQRGVDDGRAELALRQDAGGFHDGGDAGGIVIGAGSVVGDVLVGRVAAVEVALDDDDAVGIGRSALDGDDVDDERGLRIAGAGHGVGRRHDFEAAAAGGAHGAEFGFDPAAGGADAARAGLLVGDGRARAEADHFLDIGALAGFADFAGNGGQCGRHRGGRRFGLGSWWRRCCGARGKRPRKQQAGKTVFHWSLPTHRATHRACAAMLG